MAVTFDTSSMGTCGNVATDVTFSHTCAANATMLIVGCGERGIPSGVTYGGVAMTSATGAFGNGGSNNGDIYYLLNPPTGANNVVVSHSSGQITAIAMSFIGAGGISAATTATGSSTTPSITLASAATSIVVDWVNHNQGSILTATGSNQTRQQHNEQANAVAGSTTTGVASTTVSYSCVGSNAWSIGALSVDAAVATTARPSFLLNFI